MPEALGAADDTLPTQGPPPAVEPETTTLPPPVAEPTATHLEPLVAAEVARQLAHTLPVQLPPSDADLARILVRVLPQVLADDAVRTELFAVLSLEAAAKPGVLGELTGLRRYLKRELAQVAEELAHQQATVPT
jgi:uncharacterized protein (DUF2236 family)